MMSSPSSALIVEAARFGAERLMLSLPPPALSDDGDRAVGRERLHARAGIEVRGVARPPTAPKLCVSRPAASTPSVMFSAVASPVSVSVVPVTEGVTAAFAAAGEREGRDPGGDRERGEREEERYGFSASCQR